MDKYRKLQTDIEGVIVQIDKEIEMKREKINNIGKEIYQTREYTKESKEQLKELEEKRKKVAAIENKNIILFVIKEWLSNLLQEYQEYVKNKNWIGIIGVPALFAFLIAILTLYTLSTGYQGFLITSAIISIIFVGDETENLIKLHSLKKSYTYVELSETIEDITKNINQNNEDVEKSKAESKSLYAEAQKLQQDRDYFIQCLKWAVEKREKALEEVAVPKLDELFEREDVSEIITRIRAREKGSINNG